MSQTGIGYDVHELVPGRRLVLGGVEIPGDVGLAGHSDADVLLHAIMDALLGAAGLGDIGEHFPPSDETWRDADSRDLLRRVADLLGASWRIIHVDATVVAEAPKLAPHKVTMREVIAQVLQIDSAQVNIKATTNEGLGFVGRREGIAALAVATIERLSR